MVSLKKYNLNGDVVGDVGIDADFLQVSANGQMIKDYIVALRANVRQWSANTKGRTEINHSNKKPWRQKGTGNARQGSFAAPQFKGGGVVFGPKPKFDQHVRINRKERRLAVRHLISEKIKNETLVVVEDKMFAGALQEPKTKPVAAFLKKHNLYGKRNLFVGASPVDTEEETHEIFRKSARNVPHTYFVLAPNLNGYDVLAARHIVMTESALAEIMLILK